MDQEKRNFRILLVDMDDQCSIASHLLGEEMVNLMDQAFHAQCGFQTT